MTHLLHFDDLQAILHDSVAHLPDHRKPSPNRLCWLTLRDCPSFKVFFLQYTT